MRRFSDVNYYQVLGVVSTASRDQIRTAYRVKVRSAHPDHGGDPEQFAMIAEAWEVLGSESEREHYDADRRLKARASRRYTARIDRDPVTGSWSTEGAPKPEDATVTRAAASASAANEDDGLTPGQRWKKNKRRL
jgi:curved DNA-binding protein CbpA